MRWAQVPQEKPAKDGQFFTWHPRLGKTVMGYRDGNWGGQQPIWFLKDDGCPHQAPDGSFGSFEVLT